MKQAYLVMESSGEHEDYRTYHTGTVFLSLFSAEKEKQRVEEYYASETLCPVDLDKYGYFDKMLEEDLDKYDEWKREKHKKEEFNSCWIETLKVEK